MPFDWLYNGSIAILEGLLSILIFLTQLLPEPFAAPFRYPFMQRALLTSILVGGVCGGLSCFVVLKRWSLLGDAVSHSVLPGVAIAYLLGWPLFVGAFLTGLITSIGISFIERNSRIKEDAAIGIMFTGSFALGIIMISQMTTSTHLLHILFGNVLGVRMPALLLTASSSLMTLLILLLYYKEFHLFSFDPVQAQNLGINTTLLHYGLMILLTMTIVASLETVGIILVVAMLITPGATAYLLARSLSSMMVMAASLGIFSAVVGLYMSFIYNAPSGGSMVLVSTLLFLFFFLFSPRQGVVWHWFSSRLGPKS